MDYLDINRRAWDKRTRVHVNSRFYAVDAFLSGSSTLNAIELEQVGSVAGKELLHLQCHFGLDTLSWARRGARVAGVDLSSEAIMQARKLAAEAGITAEFIEKDIAGFGRDNQEQFDIVFTSYGVLCWLPDLSVWAETIANALKEDGEFHLVEFHPLRDIFQGYSYFAKPEPDIVEEGTYTENCDGEKATMVTWSHSLGEICGSLLAAGLRIEHFAEYPFSPYACFEGLEFVDGRGYQFLHRGQQVPLVFSLKARKRQSGSAYMPGKGS